MNKKVTYEVTYTAQDRTHTWKGKGRCFIIEPPTNKEELETALWFIFASRNPTANTVRIDTYRVVKEE